MMQSARAQSAAPAFDSRAVESATVISEGICSNPVIGISYRLPEGMKSQDAAAIRQVASAGAKASQGIGPEARYFLYGYKEAASSAMLCGAADEGGSVQMIALPLSAVTSEGPNALEKLVSALGQSLHAQSSAASVKAIDGLKLTCADVHSQLSPQGQKTVEIRGTTCAVVMDPYVVMWNLIGYSEAEWKRLAAGLDSVRHSAPQPLKASPPSGPPAPNAPRGPVAQDFQVRLDGFLDAWLAQRDMAKTMAFIDPGAYSAPPLIGSYCDGWYKVGAPPKQAAQSISDSLKGVPVDFPKPTAAPAIFTAWNRLPPQWVAMAANDVSKDHFLVARLDSDSLPRIFSGTFAGSDYYKFLSSQIQKSGSAYWVIFPEVMPDDDLFVIFTLWQKPGSQWTVTDMDIICQ
jgi:cytochrome c5